MPTSNLTIVALESALAGHYGSDTFYRHPIGGIVYTEGVKHLAELAGAFWLIDLIGSYQYGKVRQVPFQLWILEVKGSKGVASMREDTDRPDIVKQRIPFTDFPEGRFELWLVDKTLMLKSEY
jgi:hypothetical protein